MNNIKDICRKYDIQNYTINDDGTVDVDGNVRLYGELLTKLPLKFGKVTGSFDCYHNQLISLEGAPYWVGRDFCCSYNLLETLVGSPKWVGSRFICSGNRLTTLKEGPETVIGNYLCQLNSIINFKGFPEDYDGIISIHNNPIYHKLLKDIPYEKINKFIYWCNELNVIDDNGNVNEEWLDEVYYKIGLKC